MGMRRAERWPMGILAVDGVVDVSPYIGARLGVEDNGDTDALLLL
jgi:hypothetical protein